MLKITPRNNQDGGSVLDCRLIAEHHGHVYGSGTDIPWIIPDQNCDASGVQTVKVWTRLYAITTDCPVILPRLWAIFLTSRGSKVWQLSFHSREFISHYWSLIQVHAYHRSLDEGACCILRVASPADQWCCVCSTCHQLADTLSVCKYRDARSIYSDTIQLNYTSSVAINGLHLYDSFYWLWSYFKL